MRITVHFYSFDLSKASEQEAYQAMSEGLKASGRRPKVFAAHSSADYLYGYEPGATVELTVETKHLFSDQWNCAPHTTSGNGLRIFDWCEGVWPNKHFKQGHYVELTTELREVRRNTLKCGWCGHQEAAARGSVFCGECLGSEHLKRADLHMLRLKAIDESKERAPLNASERAYIEPRYNAVQRVRLNTKAAKYEAAHLAKVLKLQIERDGFVWLLTRGYDTENVIFYSHTGRFHFGWRNALNDEEVSELLGVLGAEFSGAGFLYEILVSKANKQYTRNLSAGAVFEGEG